MADPRTANRNYPVPFEDNTFQTDVARLVAAFTAIDVDIQAILAAVASAEDALTISGRDLAYILALANATGVLAITKGGTGATDAASARAALGVDAAIQAAIAAILDQAPTTLDTLNELAAALGDDPAFATTVTNLIATKAGLADANTFTATQKAGELALVHNTAWDASAGQDLTVNVNGSNFTVANPTNPIDGAPYALTVTYTTNHTLAFGSEFRGVLSLALTATAGTKDYFTFRRDGPVMLCTGFRADVGAA